MSAFKLLSSFCIISYTSSFSRCFSTFWRFELAIISSITVFRSFRPPPSSPSSSDPPPKWAALVNDSSSNPSSSSSSSSLSTGSSNRSSSANVWPRCVRFRLYISLRRDAFDCGRLFLPSLRASTNRFDLCKVANSLPSVCLRFSIALARKAPGFTVSRIE
uniref:Putative secreted peptide n=1 Tax=Anopheles braziliensis TaxID=58242 RepID=A0A2M3ZQD1_9DIPT